MSKSYWTLLGVVMGTLTAEPAIAEDPVIKSPFAIQHLTPSEKTQVIQFARKLEQDSRAEQMDAEGKPTFHAVDIETGHTSDSKVRKETVLTIKKAPAQRHVIQAPQLVNTSAVIVHCPGALYAIQKRVTTQISAIDLSKQSTHTDVCYIQNSSGQKYFTEAELLAKGAELIRRVKTAKGRLFPEGLYPFSDTGNEAAAKLVTIAEIVTPSHDSFGNIKLRNPGSSEGSSISDIQKLIETALSTPAKDADLDSAELLTTREAIKEMTQEKAGQDFSSGFEDMLKPYPDVPQGRDSDSAPKAKPAR